jgi:hypothetical protein
MKVKIYILHVYITYVVKVNYAYIQNFSLLGADPDAIYNLY